MPNNQLRLEKLQVNKEKFLKPQTHRTKWADTGKLIATFSSESLARFMFESANRSFPGEVILEQIPADEPEYPRNFGYGRDETE